jgi:magnesium transporter
MSLLQEWQQIKGLNIQSIAWEELTWVNIVNPGEKEMEYLSKNYSFHPLDLDDCLSRIQIPKLDIYENYLFFIFQYSVYDKKTRVSTRDQVSVFLGDKYIITIHSGKLKPMMKLFRDCEINEKARLDNMSNGPGYILYRILDRTVDAMFPILDKIMSTMEDVEDSVFDAAVETAQELAILRRDIITQRLIAFPIRTIINQLESNIKRYCKTDISVYFGDLLDHMNKVCETLDECKETIEVFKDADWVLGTERLNKIMRVLTIIATVALPFIGITSLYGMNVHMPGGITEGNWVPFIVIMLVITILTGAMLIIFRRNRWI